MTSALPASSATHPALETAAPQPAGTAPYDDPVEHFIATWQGKDGSERANYQLFVTQLCELLALPLPQPAQADSAENAYVFERHVKLGLGDGSQADRYLDCYRRGAFVLEAKKIRAGAHTRGFDDALMRARAQAEGYARALPASEGRPPFLVVVDVGHVIELYAEFTRSGATYTPFPDSRSHRIPLAALREPRVRERLRKVWLDPLSLDPSRISAEVTREVAARLAELARSLEADGHASERVAAFLTRALFCMFAEDVELLPRDSFRGLLERHRDDPATLTQMLRVLWTDMDTGGFSPALARQVLRFNGKIFKGHGQDGYVLPLTRPQIDQLIAAARADWKAVEPAIFGTLLERALNPDERHALGAHYTPRAYVERLVLPTVIEPLRRQWADTQAAALLLAREAHDLLHPLDARGQPKAPTRRQELDAEKKRKAACDEIRRFHHHLCTLRVLDPACGSGNFLYVTLEHLKRLEGEVLNQLHDLGESQSKLGLEGETVTPRQLLGIELNRRAAALAELVLWIGHLQWHIRTQGNASVAEPVVHDFGNIEHRDAVLAYDGQQPAYAADGSLLTRWDGKTFKPHPVTGEPVPDESAQVPQWQYLNPRPAAWPQADYIVGNPPFIGASAMRAALGDGYVQALRGAWPGVPESADFVMYWWDHAARLVRQGQVQRFGLITTNSLRQTFNRRVIEAHLSDTKAPLHLAFAVPDHPWVDSGDGAAVRIAMSVGAPGPGEGRLLTSVAEAPGEHDEVAVVLEERVGSIHADLRIGANVAGAKPLRGNAALAFRGVTLMGSGFWVSSTDPLLTQEPGALRELRNGKDLANRPRHAHVIDFHGLDMNSARQRFPHAFQRVLHGVKPERDQSQRETYRNRWWTFAESRPEMRQAVSGLGRYIASPMTAKHRNFVFLDERLLADQGLVVVACRDALLLGVLSSQAHIEWALAAGGRLGVGNDPRYNNSRCFETFPFPADDTGFDPASPLAARIRELAEQIDAHRKRVLASPEGAQAGLTLTGLYNVIEALRAGRPLSAKEKLHHQAGLAGVLLSLHEELDAAVLAAYGWADLGPTPWADAEARQAWTDTLLERLVALNARRAADEARGLIRWLRPDYQDPARRTAPAATAPEEQPPVPAPLAPAAPSAASPVDHAALPSAGATASAGEPGIPPADGGAPADDDADADTDEDARAGADAGTDAARPVLATATRRPWPPTLPEQMRATAEVLAASPAPLTEAQLAGHFKGQGPWKKRLPQILQTLEAVGRARHIPAEPAGRWAPA